LECKEDKCIVVMRESAGKNVDPHDTYFYMVQLTVSSFTYIICAIQRNYKS